MKNVYVFHGADRKVGVTMTAQSAAEWIAGAAPEADVLLLTMCGRQNVQYQKRPAPPIDRYRSRIESGVGISKKDIPAMKLRYRKHRKGYNDNIKENLYIISGIENEQEERLYKPEIAEKLIESVCEQFDIIIVDAGSEIDSGLAIGALKMARERFLVLSQSEAAFSRYEKFKKVHDEIGVVFSNFVINKYDEESPYTAEYLKKRFELENVSEKSENQTVFYDIAKVQHADSAETEYRTFVSLKEKRYIRDVEKMCRVILAEAGINGIKNRGKRDGRILFRRLYADRKEKS